jgi:hypothetical protein
MRRPSSVSWSCRVVRLKSAACNTASRLAMPRLTADGVTSSALAAAAKLPVSAARTSISSRWARSIFVSLSHE